MEFHLEEASICNSAMLFASIDGQRCRGAYFWRISIAFMIMDHCLKNKAVPYNAWSKLSKDESVNGLVPVSFHFSFAHVISKFFINLPISLRFEASSSLLNTNLARSWGTNASRNWIGQYKSDGSRRRALWKRRKCPCTDFQHCPKRANQMTGGRDIKERSWSDAIDFWCDAVGFVLFFLVQWMRFYRGYRWPRRILLRVWIALNSNLVQTQK